MSIKGKRNLNVLATKSLASSAATKSQRIIFDACQPSFANFRRLHI